MDTRTKIVERAALPAKQPNIVLAAGWFDVLTAEHCALLQEAKPPDSSLLVLVYRETPERPTPLPGRDRAQMVAALDSVDWVTVCPQAESVRIATDLSVDSVVDIDAVQRRDVVRDVIERHSER